MEIVLCPDCRGRGWRDTLRPTGLNAPMLEYTKGTCPKCQGDGRMIKIVSYKRLGEEKE
jgi:DnaJ-class molecular chaperone